jgi:hypothetical protein
MLLKYFGFFLLCVLGFVAAANRGSYTVPGLGKRKQEILNNGGGV